MSTQQSSIDINHDMVKISAETNIGSKEEVILAQRHASSSSSSGSGSSFSFSWGNIPGIGQFFASANKNNQPKIERSE